MMRNVMVLNERIISLKSAYLWDLKRIFEIKLEDVIR